MLLSEQITYARRRARINTNDVDSSYIRNYINEGVNEFSKRTDGIPTETFLLVSPLFNLTSYSGWKMIITGGDNAGSWNLYHSGTSLASILGASLAVAWKAIITAQASVSVSMTWNSASWVFQLVDGAAVTASSIQVQEVTGNNFIDCNQYLFNKLGTGTAIFTGEIPLNCTYELDLPSDFISVESVEWDDDILLEAPYENFISPFYMGTPKWYAIRGKKLRLMPAPLSREYLRLVYKKRPTDLDTTGTDDATSCPLPSEYHFAPVYYAAHMIADDMHEQDISSMNLMMFNDDVKRYKLKNNNQNPRLVPRVRETAQERVQFLNE